MASYTLCITLVDSNVDSYCVGPDGTLMDSFTIPLYPGDVLIIEERDYDAPEAYASAERIDLTNQDERPDYIQEDEHGNLYTRMLTKTFVIQERAR